MDWDAAKDTWEAVLVFGVVMVTASQVGGGVTQLAQEVF